jgi:hypothetical protein
VLVARRLDYVGPADFVHRVAKKVLPRSLTRNRPKHERTLHAETGRCVRVCYAAIARMAGASCDAAGPPQDGL